MTAEATLREQVLKRIHEDYPRRTSGVLVFGRPASAATGPGHPDLFGVALGRFLALEIKMPKAQPTPLQVQRIQDLRRAGAYAWVIRTPLDATRAVYQVKIGGRVPNPDDAIDFDDWFKEITSGKPAEATATIADKAEASTEADSVSLDEALALDEDAAAQPAAEVERPRRGRKAKAQPAPAPEPAPLEELPSFDEPFQALPAEPEPIQAAADRDQSTAYLVEIVKAVGDRITEVYEQGARIEAKLDKLSADFDALIEGLD